MTECKECGCEQGFGVCVPCLHKENNQLRALSRVQANTLQEVEEVVTNPDSYGAERSSRSLGRICAIIGVLPMPK